jgi:hypothetical protein
MRDESEASRSSASALATPKEALVADTCNVGYQEMMPKHISDLEYEQMSCFIEVILDLPH